MDIKKIKIKVKKILSKHRYEHTISVAKFAKKLALINGVNEEKAYLAGLLHDIAKEFSLNEIISLTKDDPNFSKYPNVKTLHGLAGAYYASKFLKIDDKEVLNAIKNHVIPPKKCSKLSMIIYIADKLDPNRKKYYNIANSEKYKILAQKNITKCFTELYKIMRK
ncbi:MAG: bis(5'-nucleosyl)-tetraphosphatase (symmetrical) YqeK [Mycoplasmataceae bacterium]|jgi:nicotinate-nucleotide adenylyltransferase|nr:bis(5'-nucleosyl)-tetraphosphatase (symmetrical) YqeK [Mycoplasmataceae bacterium]